jgi:hypothetical protein
MAFPEAWFSVILLLGLSLSDKSTVHSSVPLLEVHMLCRDVPQRACYMSRDTFMTGALVPIGTLSRNYNNRGNNCD